MGELSLDRGIEALANRLAALQQQGFAVAAVAAHLATVRELDANGDQQAAAELLLQLGHICDRLAVGSAGTKTIAIAASAAARGQQPWRRRHTETASDTARVAAATESRLRAVAEAAASASVERLAQRIEVALASSFAGLGRRLEQLLSQNSAHAAPVVGTAVVPRISEEAAPLIVDLAPWDSQPTLDPLTVRTQAREAVRALEAPPAPPTLLLVEPPPTPPAGVEASAAAAVRSSPLPSVHGDDDPTRPVALAASPEAGEPEPPPVGAADTGDAELLPQAATPAAGQISAGLEHHVQRSEATDGTGSSSHSAASDETGTRALQRLEELLAEVELTTPMDLPPATPDQTDTRKLRVATPRGGTPRPLLEEMPTPASAPTPLGPMSQAGLAPAEATLATSDDVAGVLASLAAAATPAAAVTPAAEQTPAVRPALTDDASTKLAEHLALASGPTATAPAATAATMSADELRALLRDELPAAIRRELPALLSDPEIRTALFGILAVEMVSKPGLLGELSGLRTFLRDELERQRESLAV